MTTTRIAALALVLMTGTAFAAPTPQSRSRAFQRVGNMHAGVDKMQAKASALGEKISINVAKMKAAHQERKVAEKDFQAWLDEKGNENIKTYYKGAASEAGVPLAKAVKVASRVSTVGLLTFGAATGSPLLLAPGLYSIYGAIGIDERLRVAKQTAAGRTVSRFKEQAPAERLKLWSKGEVIDRERAK